MSEQLVLAAIAIVAASGMVGLLFSRHSAAGQYVATALASAGSVIGIGGLIAFWMQSSSRTITYPWSVPGGEFAVGVDGLSAVFLLPVFLVSLLGNIYGLEYWAQVAHPENGRKLRLFYGLVTAGMALLVVARNSLLFLVGWEIMALSAFFLVTTEDHDQEVREAGWVYLACTHTATLCLFALFALLRSGVGSFSLTPIPAEAVTNRFETAVFTLAVLGFGLKAGVMPLHLWLPGAHAMAPSHVSALMSGVLIKMGIYGLVRDHVALSTSSRGVGCRAAGIGNRFRRVGSGVCTWTTRPQAIVGLSQRRKHRHHRDGYRAGADRTVVKPLRLDRVGAERRVAPRLESCLVQGAVVS